MIKPNYLVIPVINFLLHHTIQDIYKNPPFRSTLYTFLNSTETKMGLVPCLLVALLAVHHVASTGAPQPISSLDSKQQEIVDFAVVQLQVSYRVEGKWEYSWIFFLGWRARAL